MNVTVFEAINITKKYRNTLALNQVGLSEKTVPVKQQ